MQAPTVDELLTNGVFLQAMESAWQDSMPHEPSLRHEEGGWVYTKIATGEVLIRRSAAGAKSEIDLSHPPIVDEAVVVATFHTHPQPTSEGWLTEPSAGDTRLALAQGVPCFIRAEDGVHVTGPESRRGGLTGAPSFPS